MDDQRCRVTVVGSVKRADVALMARAAIGEYINAVALLCEEPVRDSLPAAWSLSLPDGRLLPAASSLDSAGIIDGQVLYLCDAAAAEAGEPVALRVVPREMVRLAGDAGEAGAAGVATGWSAAARANVVLVAVAAWLAAGTISWLITGSHPGWLAAIVALAADLELAVVALAGRSTLEWPVRFCLAMAVVPCLAAAGWFAGQALASAMAASSQADAVIGLAAGAFGGSLVALAVVPGIAASGVAALTLLAAAGAMAFASAGVTGAQAAAVAALLGYVLLSWLPEAARPLRQILGQTSYLRRNVGTRYELPGFITGAGIALAAVLAATLALAATSDNSFALAAAGCLATAAVLRTATYRRPTEAVPLLAAGLTGWLALALRVPGYIGGPGWLPLADLLVASTAALALGVAWVPGPGGHGHKSAASQRPVVARVLAGACLVAAVPLVAGAFGVFGYFIAFGRQV